MTAPKKSRRSSIFRATVGLGALFASLTVAQMAHAQQIVVQGNRRVDAETIRSYVTGAGAGSLEEARRALLASGMFSSVSVARRGAQIVVTVNENQIVNRVVFEGARAVQREILEQEVQTRARGPYNPATIEADVRRISDVYLRAGRGTAAVQPRIVDLPNGRVDVVFGITEGGKTGIREISFSGNQAFSDSRLRGLMASSEMNLLSWFKTSDVYDPDRIAADLELIRRYYLKHGYADFRVVSSDARFDAARAGWVVQIVVDEGPQYRVGDIQLDSRVALDPELLRRQIRTRPGDVYDAQLVERTLNDITLELARRGYAFANVRPAGARDPASRTLGITYIVEEGPRVYVERINVRGNTRTRDYVIRREMDIGEGDAYNRVLLDRAERRLNNLGYFKRVRVTNEPGTAPDRVIVNVDVEDQPTGSFAISGGYSTADGVIAEVSLSESNFLGRGQFVRLAGSTGQRTRGIDFSFTEPYFLGYRLAAGFDLFSRYADQTQYARYESRTTGGQLRLGIPVTENFGVTLRYSLFESHLKIPNTIRKPYNDCSVPIPGYTAINPPTDPFTLSTGAPGESPNRIFCEYNGEASLAIKESQGRRITSLGGITLVYSTLDIPRDPRNGFYVELKPDVAGLGGDSRYFRTVADARYYYELFENVVGIARVQGGHIMGFGGRDLHMIDHFFMGPTLVRGFAISGIGPRDVSTLDSRANAIGGTTYFGGSLEVQFPIFGLPRELGLKGAVFADAGTLFGYKGIRQYDVNRNGIIECGTAATVWTVSPECLNVRDNKMIRSSVGASLLWASPLGPIRFDYAVALSKDKGIIVNGQRIGGDVVQAFRFSGGARF